jgi:hypothetical protein
MQAFVGEYSTVDATLIKTLEMSKIGSVDVGKCSKILVDPLKDEYISSITIRWGQTHVTKISISASTG